MLSTDPRYTAREVTRLRGTGRVPSPPRGGYGQALPQKARLFWEYPETIENLGGYRIFRDGTAIRDIPDYRTLTAEINIVEDGSTPVAFEVRSVDKTGELLSSPCPITAQATVLGSTDVTYADGTPIENLKPAQVGADVTASHTAASITGQGSLATKNSVDLASSEVANKNIDNLSEGSTNKFFNGKTVDDIGEGTTYKRTTVNEKTGASKGYDLYQGSSTPLNSQGSVAPVSGTAGPFTYTTGGPASGKMFARLTWSLHTRYRPDGTSYNVAASSGLTVPALPSLSNMSAANALGARTYYVRVALFLGDGDGERKFVMAGVSGGTSGSWDNATLCKVLSPAAENGYVGWLPLVGSAAAGEVLQPTDYSGIYGVGAPVPFGTDWVEPVTGALLTGGTTPTDDNTAAALRDWDNPTPKTLYAWPSIKLQASAPNYTALQVRLPGGFLDDNNRPDIAAQVWADGFDSDSSTWITFTMPAAGGSGGGSGGGGCPRVGFMQRTLKHGGTGVRFQNRQWTRLLLENGAVSEDTPSNAIYRADAEGELAAYLPTVPSVDDLDHAVLRPFKIHQEQARVGDLLISHDDALRPTLSRVVSNEAFEEDGEAIAISMEEGHLFLVGKSDGPGIVSCNRKVT